VLQSRAAAVDAVQRDKRRSGLTVRDPGREQEVIAHVASRVPRLSAEAVGRVMTAVIDGCVEASERSAVTDKEAGTISS
jgi:chorismate mutase